MKVANGFKSQTYFQEFTELSGGEQTKKPCIYAIAETRFTSIR